jgi:hypothetical protein
MHRLIEKEGEIGAEFLCFLILSPQMNPLTALFIWRFDIYSVLRRAIGGKNGCAT